MMNSSPLTPSGQILRLNAEETEQRGLPAAASLDVLRDSGALALRTPLEYGGEWADAPAAVRRLAELGRGCPSAAWVAATSATAKTLLTQGLGADAHKEVFGDPDSLACGSGHPSGRGVREASGVRVSGQWDNVSGCEAAAWANLAVMVDDTYHVAAVPLGDLRVERNWHMAGMRGTGSQRLVADGLLIPAHRIAPGGPPRRQDQLFFALCLLAPVVGGARGALDTVEEMFRSGRKPYMTGYAGMGDSPGARHWLARAAWLVERAERTALTTAQDSTREDLDEAAGARLRAGMADAAKDCRDAVELMLDLHGAAGFRETNALQRYWRDIAVAGRHPLLCGYLAAENLGTALVS
ncbi:acyl-CoA dehydrogenase family protein [Actinacidiphila sp. bgisy144]|uniref:acyl-CoA dehydrogenase family protein n=1 Tax=Actinacidiphila sp. bgisy144 TaxID=3413791 RepID=UPI003EB74626